MKIDIAVCSRVETRVVSHRLPQGRYTGATDDVEATPVELHGIHPRDELRLLAYAASTDAAGMEAVFASDGPPLAHLLIFEGWIHAYSHPAEYEGGDLADVPGSLECRFALARVGAQRIVLQRVRGESPVIASPGAYDGVGATGIMDESLRDIHYAAARHWGAAL